MQPSVPQPSPIPSANDLSLQMHELYGSHAIAAARSALAMAARKGDAVNLDLWSEICAKLAMQSGPILL